MFYFTDRHIVCVHREFTCFVSFFVSDVIHGYGGMFPMHGPLPPYGMIMEYKRLLEGAALPGSLNYQYIAANYFQLHSKCDKIKKIKHIRARGVDDDLRAWQYARRGNRRDGKDLPPRRCSQFKRIKQIEFSV